MARGVPTTPSCLRHFPVGSNGFRPTEVQSPPSRSWSQVNLHVRPHFLAGTRRLLYRVSSGNGRDNSYYVTSLDAGERKLIATLDAGNVTYSQGHLLFMQNHTLMAQPFDLKNLAITGSPRPLAHGVLLSTGSPPVFGVFSASQTGRLVYLSQGRDYDDPMTVLSNWADSPAGR